MWNLEYTKEEITGTENIAEFKEGETQIVFKRKNNFN